MFPVELKKVFDRAVKDSIEQIQVIFLAFKEGELDLKSHIDNKIDFYIGIVIATIFEKYAVYAAMTGKFTKQQIMSPNPLIAYNIFQMIPTLKEKIKEQVGL
jgi:hypothetical protein